MSHRKQFGNILREFRKKAGLSQRALARKVGVSHTYISKIENHKLDHTPSIRTLGKMAEALGIDSADMIRAANKIPSILDPFMRDPEALKFFRRASGMISNPEGWREMQRILEEKVEKGEIE